MASRQSLMKFAPEAENTFKNFVEGGNEETVGCLRLLCVDDNPVNQIYLSGASASGKSHLLQAVCHYATEAKQRAIYLPMRQVSEYGADVLGGLEAMDVICIDDVDALAGRMAWEEALFNLINRIRSGRGCLLLAAADVPRNAGFQLADLSSRLVWGGVYRLAALADDAKARAIKLRTRTKGYELSEEVVGWLLAHCSRDMNYLIDATAKLEEASLLNRRRITVPFARSVLGDDNS